jgi:hypothetical protein
LPGDSDAYLFVAGTLNGIEEFAPGASKPLRTLKSSAEFVFLDSLGTLYAASFDENFISVFAPKTRTLERTISTVGPQILAFDSHDNLYESNSGAFTGCPAKPPPSGRINVFAPGETKPFRTIKLGEHPHATGLAIDAADQLFAGVSSEHASNSQCPPYITFSGAHVNVYAAGSSKLLRKVTDGISPSSIPTVIVNASGTLYELNQQVGSSEILMYAHGSIKPTKIIKPPYVAYAIMLNSSGNLFTLLVPPGSDCIIDVYTGAGKLLDTIKTPVRYCQTFTLDRSNDLYILGVGAHGYPNVTILGPYGKGSSRVIKTPGATSIAVGPE